MISLIIAYWNNAVYLQDCLTKLSEQTYSDFEIIIIDNGSQDNGIVDIENKFPGLDIRLEHLTTNLGFAVANNIGARLAKGTWLALLNTDAFPEPEWLEKLIHATQEHPEFSCFSSRQIQAREPSYIDGAGDAYHVSGLAWKRYLGYLTNKYGLENIEVFSACGAAALYERKAFLEASGFDEDFFSYYEDVDLGFRLRLLGYRCLYIADAVVYHVGSATFGLQSDFAFYHSHRNMVWSFFQNMPTNLLLRYLPAHIIANLIYLVYYTMRGRGKVLWKAKLDAVRGLPKALRKRRHIQLQRKAGSAEILMAMERGLLQPYLLGYHLRRTLSAVPKSD